MNVRQLLLVIAVCWLLSACGMQPTPHAMDDLAALPMTAPSQTAAPTEVAAPQIISFAVLPNPVERGQDVIVSWEVNGAVGLSYGPINLCDLRIRRSS
jgi:hypothetical protein